MAETAGFQVTLHEWHECAARASAVRAAVFVEEQGVSQEEEQDGRDAQCVHALARLNGVVVGTGRLRPEGGIGRMAVLPAYRGKGVGGMLLQALLQAAISRGHDQVYLAAQEHALAFYLRYGFLPEGERFFEAGMPHVMMRRELPGAAAKPTGR